VNEDLQPCNECSTCKAIDSDTLIGVQYFSMANNGEVDNVRRIVQDAQTKVAINEAENLQTVEALLDQFVVEHLEREERQKQRLAEI